MKYTSKEKLLREEYLPYIKDEKEITENVIRRFKNDLIKLKES